MLFRSLIGPRPLLPRDVAYMNSEQHKRHLVRPGLTGLAQCSGRNLLNWDAKLEMDTVYVNNITLLGDIEIIWKTLVGVCRKDGICFEEGTDMDLKDWNELKMRNEDIK